ncbi:glycosyltransferase [Paenibacillus arenilitoris]|uniref:Glycosyltransferase n=1 Tax=Paenibacillus arenilitoris TaxID=2772299 RepID=A0A927CRG3_9BACL|nr:glycosyltransferase [Paenibacillus arenilitoris]MBD2870280.1 glycosyltransferase [Paenibacillus arenilitoris]
MKSKLLKMVLAGMLAVSILGLAAAGASASAEDYHHRPEHGITPAMAKLKGDMRKLWFEHVIWSRSFIVSALAGLQDQDKVLARLLKNQQDIGNAIKPYYGDAAGDQLAKLLTEHIELAGQVLNAAKSGNQREFDKANKEWYRNADDIAKFLSDANPNWSNQQLREMLHVHLQLLWADMEARLKKDWDASIAAFDKGEDHIIMLADVLADGIIKQFPDKFR